MYFETLHGEISCIASDFVEHHVNFLNDFIKKSKLSAR